MSIKCTRDETRNGRRKLVQMVLVKGLEMGVEMGLDTVVEIRL